MRSKELLWGKFPIRRRGLNDIEDEAVNGLFVAATVIFDRHGERSPAPSHLPPLGSIERLFPSSGLQP